MEIMEFLNKDRLDQLLQIALQQYGNAEPRPGLQGRVLANLTAEKPAAAKWRWGLGFAGCFTLALALWFTNRDRLSHKMPFLVSNDPEILRIEPIPRAPAAMLQATSRKEISAVRGRVNYRAKETQSASGPRLPQFPSQHPLSVQEQLLKRYVQQLPGEAMIVAKAQTERQEELRKLFASRPSKMDPDRQER
jgi:hypothetical protein